MILLTIVVSFGSGGCAGSGPQWQAARIADLEGQNAELEHQLTELKEQRLSEERSHCNLASTTESSDEPKPAKPTIKNTVPARQGAPEHLRVVRLSPGQNGAPAVSYDEASSEAVAAEQAPTSAAEGQVFPESTAVQTRTVLKVHGSGEGKVYDRALTAADGESSSAL